MVIKIIFKLVGTSPLQFSPQVELEKILDGGDRSEIEGDIKTQEGELDLHWFEMFQSYHRMNPIIFSPVEGDYSVFYLFEQVGPRVRGEDGKRDSIWIQGFGES